MLASNFRLSKQMIYRTIGRGPVGGGVKRADVMNDFLRNDIIILVIGSTGAGKSTFINALAGHDVASVGHDLGSHTSEIQHFILNFPKDPTRRVIVIDTPGFDDTYVEDTEILRRISVWIARVHSNKLKLTGIIYLHEISQSRMLGMSRNIELLNKLCGEETTKNVILATTKWDCVWEEVGSMRERELAEYWKRMLDLGSVMCRLRRTSESAWEVVELLVSNFEQRTPIPFPLTREASVGVDQKEVIIRPIPTLDGPVEIKTNAGQSREASSVQASSEKQEKPKGNGNRFRSVVQQVWTPDIPRSNRAAHIFRVQKELVEVLVEADKREMEDRRALDNVLKELLEAQTVTLNLVRTGMGIQGNYGLLEKLEDNQNTLQSTLQHISAPNVLPSRRFEDALRIREELIDIERREGEDRHAIHHMLHELLEVQKDISESWTWVEMERQEKLEANQNMLHSIIQQILSLNIINNRRSVDPRKDQPPVGGEDVKTGSRYILRKTVDGFSVVGRCIAEQASRYWNSNGSRFKLF